MAPKKRATASTFERGEGSEAPPAVPWECNRFDSPEVQDLHDNAIRGRSFIFEKEFPRFPQPNERFVDTLRDVYDADKLMQPREMGYLSLVREWYAYAAHNNKMTCKVRQKVVTISVLTFRNHFDLPAVPNCRFKYWQTHQDELDLQEVANLLTRPGMAHWKMAGGRPREIKREHLNREARIWAHFIACNLIPVLHLSDVTKERAVLIYLLMRGDPVDLAAIMYDTLRKQINNHRKGLAFPHLISTMCKENGVKTTAKDETFKPRDPFDYKSIKVDDGGAEPAEPEEEEQMAGMDAPIPPPGDFGAGGFDPSSFDPLQFQRQLDSVSQDVRSLKQDISSIRRTVLAIAQKFEVEVPSDEEPDPGQDVPPPDA